MQGQRNYQVLLEIAALNSPPMMQSVWGYTEQQTMQCAAVAFKSMYLIVEFR